MYSTVTVNLLEDFTKAFYCLMKNISILSEIDFSHLSKGNVHDGPLYIMDLLEGPGRSRFKNFVYSS